MKTLILMLLCLLPVLVNAAATTSTTSGQYNGIWQTSPPLAYIVVYEKTGTMAVILNYLQNQSWEASAGALTGKKVSLKTLIGFATIVSDISFSSVTDATLTIVSCTPNPGAICPIQQGTVMTMKKIW